MAVAFKTAGTGQVGVNTTLTVAWPAGHVKGDLAVLQVTADNVSGINFANMQGFALAGSETDVSSTFQTAVYWLIATSSAMASPTITAGATQHVAAQINTYSGAKGINAGVGSANGNGSTTINFDGSVTPHAPGAGYVMGGGYTNGVALLTTGSNSNLSGITLEFDTSLGDALLTHAQFFAVNLTATAPGTTTGTFGGASHGYASNTLILEPAVYEEGADDGAVTPNARPLQPSIYTRSRASEDEVGPSVPPIVEDDLTVLLRPLAPIRFAPTTPLEDIVLPRPVDDLDTPYPNWLRSMFVPKLRSMWVGDYDEQGALAHVCILTHMSSFIVTDGRVHHMPSDAFTDGRAHHMPSYQQPVGGEPRPYHMPSYIKIRPC